MKTDIYINNQKIAATKGQTILNLLKNLGIRIPTLCNLSMLTPTGACRLCVVEVEGQTELVTACSHPVKENMRIHTHSPRVLKARKTLLELLLANHPDDCLYCKNNQQCELQELAIELNIRERKFRGTKKEQHIDHSSQAIVKDTSKCILCGRCIRICDEIMNVNAIDYSGRGHKTKVNTCMSKGLNFSTCISCGQCVIACPTRALSEMSSLDKLIKALRNDAVSVYIHISSEVILSICRYLGLKPGLKAKGMLISAISKCGFEKVFDSGFAGDIFIEETKKELNGFLAQKKPYILTHCPSVKSYIEQFFPELTGNTNHLKSSWQIMSGIVKNMYAEKDNIKPDNLFTVSVNTCTSSKAEAWRVDMMTNSIQDLDAVLSVSDIVQLFKLNGIEIQKLDKKEFDFPYNMSSSAASLIDIPGGLTEAVLRSMESKKSGFNGKIQELRGIKSEKTIERKPKEKRVKIKIVNEIRHAIPHLNAIAKGNCDFDVLEISASPVVGSESNKNQQLHASDIYKNDDSSPNKVSGSNPLLKAFYNDNRDVRNFEDLFYYNLQK
ncbi:MAG: [Fe-Fe] hydrogenase large subunit C-terminal domain-containing protein [Bacteroidales bacterium]